jgi:protein-disulfide isomerase
VRRPLILALAVALLGGAAYAAAGLSNDQAGPPQIQDATALAPDQIKAFADAWAQQPRTDLGIAAGTAKVVIVKFNDYQCGGCAATHVWYKPILEKFEKSNPGAVLYVLKDWPWAMKCNSSLRPEMGAPEHPGACEGAVAARLARAQGKAKELEMQDWLFNNLRSLTPDVVKDAVEKILGVKNFAAEYARLLPEVRKDVEQGVALRIGSTPTYFINGVRLEGPQMPAAYFDLAIQLELKRSAGK